MKKFIIALQCFMCFMAHASLSLQETSETLQLLEQCVTKYGSLESFIANLRTQRDFLESQYVGCKERIESVSYVTALSLAKECRRIKKEHRNINKLLVYIYERKQLSSQKQMPQLGIKHNPELEIPQEDT